MLKNKRFLSVFITFGYIPYWYSPNSEAIINQTKRLVTKKWMHAISSQMGLSFSLKSN